MQVVMGAFEKTKKKMPSKVPKKMDCLVVKLKLTFN